MDVLFINPTEQMRLSEEVNGTMLLATKLLQAGFNVQMLRFGQAEHYMKDYKGFIASITDRILQLQPKCISLYTLWPYYHVTLRIARSVKEQAPHIYIVLGGPQASATAVSTMESQPYIDYICTGEGENTVVPFFSALFAGDMQALAAVPGVYWRQDGKVLNNPRQADLCDLNTLPYWDDRLYLEHYDHSQKELESEYYYMPIDAGRGCPYNCTFCCTSHFWKRTYRLKSPDRIIADIRYYQEKFGIRSFWFSHDAFTTDRKLVSQVCDRILENGMDISWKCTARIDCITEELVLKMKQAGLQYIELGVETGSPRMQKLIKKNLDLQRVKTMVKFLLDSGLEVGLFFMYGFPEETEEDLNATLELQMTLLDMGVSDVSTSFCRFSPQTAITEQWYDDLVLDMDMKLLFRGVFGYEDELDMIRDHKALFCHLYHLPTPLRNQYHYTRYLVYLYKRFPMTGRYLRALFHGDNLAFYRAYYDANSEIFQSVKKLIRTVKEQPVQVATNILNTLDHPKAKQVLAMLTFESDLRALTKSAQNTAIIRKVYDFDHRDLQAKKPLEELATGKTEILLRKVGDQVSVNLLRFIEE